MTTGATDRTHPRERLLDTAGRLFYTQGIHAVGVEQLVTEAGVTRATFYRHFAGKEGLVVAYLEARGAGVEDAVAAILAAHRGRDALLAIMDMIGDNLCRPGFRGCGFLNAAAEYPDPAHRCASASPSTAAGSTACCARWSATPVIPTPSAWPGPWSSCGTARWSAATSTTPAPSGQPCARPRRTS
ncbi:TetR/AcrR family transcriptional regulator [Streptomyces albulus]|nr:TetR/AcrR family transcriptional regulator [Streptomyces noursei]